MPKLDQEPVVSGDRIRVRMIVPAQENENLLYYWEKIVLTDEIDENSDSFNFETIGESPKGVTEGQISLRDTVGVKYLF